MKNKERQKIHLTLFTFGFILITWAALLSAAPTAKDYTTLVDPFIGTLDYGNTFSGPATPYGMVQLTPYMHFEEEDGSGILKGFQHTSNSGSAGGGNRARGEIVFMPFVVDDASNLADMKFESHFSHDQESASPGYYKIIPDAYPLSVELTASFHSGLHKYNFDETGNAGVALKLDNGSITMTKDEISGYEISPANKNKVYFYAKLSKPADSYEFIENGKTVNNTTSLEGEKINALFNFSTQAGESVMLKVGISYVSVDGAKNNVLQEIPNWDFDRIVQEAVKSWNTELGKIEVSGGTETDQTIFYTAFYHSLIHPNLYTDVDGKYHGADGKVYTAKDFTNYTTFSLWDTFRALHPLYTIINQERTSDFIKSFLERYDHRGRMLIMDFRGVEGESAPMIGYHSVSVLADAYVKGIRDYDITKAYKAMVHLAKNSGRQGMALYLNYGYIPSDLVGQSVSRTLEYCYDDWCVTRMAKDFNNADYQYFSRRGQFFKNVFSQQVNFMRGRKSNFEFVPNFDPMETINHYTEANAYQYSTYVPQDVAGLINLMGGDKAFEAWLDACFTTQTDFSKINVADVTGLIGQYAHGNEPSHHISYLYNYVGTPWKTQEMTRKIMATLYKATPDGIDGNEDCGQMSAWYVMSAMGLYSVTPGQTYYTIGSPAFNNIKIHLENGKTFEIVANNNSPENVYIQSAQLNGKSYTKTFLEQEDIMNGGTLVFEMANVPNKTRGTAKADRPYAPEHSFVIAKAPEISFPNILFLDHTTITMAPAEPGAEIRYTLDGSEPNKLSMLYTQPITIGQETLFKTKSFVDGKLASDTKTVHFKTIAMLDAVAVTGELHPGVSYLYKEGEIASCRDLPNHKTLKTGVLEYFHVNEIPDSRQFGYNLTGYLLVPETGVYSFGLEANDGAVLYLNDKIIIDNDGGHRAQRLDTKIGLKKGWHPIRVDYFQQGLAKSLDVYWQGPGIEYQALSPDVLFHK